MNCNESDTPTTWRWYDWVLWMAVILAISTLFNLLWTKGNYETYRKGEVEPIIKKIKYPNDSTKTDTIYKYIRL